MPLVASLATVGVAGCSNDDKAAIIPRTVVGCPVCENPVQIGTLGDDILKETSGVVASAAHEGVLWIHNDSGDTARIFAIDHSGARLATLTLEHASAVDYEDIALGPCPEGTCLFVGDIGDNITFRDYCSVYRFPEPAVIEDATVKVTEIRYAYPDAPHNAETLLVHPLTGALMVLTKEKTGPSHLFEIPTNMAGQLGDDGKPRKAMAETRGEVTPVGASNLFTGGDIDRTGSVVVLRTYSNVLAYPIPLSNLVGDALKQAPCVLPAPDEGDDDGEAVAFEGQSLVTLREGQGAPVNRIQCSW